MTTEQELVGWLLVLVLTVLFFFAGIQIRDWLDQRSRPPAPVYKAERFSLRREK